MKPENLVIKNNEAFLHQYKLADLATTYHTPLYVYDKADIIHKMKLYKESFVSKLFSTTIVYACKAFLVPKMIDLLKENNLYMDSVSLGDMALAKANGFDMNHILFHGNNKTDEELNYAIDNSIGFIICDNLHELKRLVKIAETRKQVIHTMFRINPLIDCHTHKYIQTANNISKFGECIEDESCIDEIMSTYKNSSYVKLFGFHAHIGSSIHEAAPFLLLSDKMIEFSKTIEAKYNIQLPYLNLGGGMGIRYEEGEVALNQTDFLKSWINHIEKKIQEVRYNLKRVFIEPGRSIVGEAGMTLYTIGDTKRTFGGKNYLFIDGGMTDNIRPSLYNAKYHAMVCNHVVSKDKQIVDIAGKCCESGDILIHDECLPVTKAKDILAIFTTGAYTYQMFMEYNSMLRPMVVFVDETGVEVVSKRQTIEEYINRF